MYRIIFNSESGKKKAGDNFALHLLCDAASLCCSFCYNEHYIHIQIMRDTLCHHASEFRVDTTGKPAAKCSLTEPRVGVNAH